MSLVTLDDLLPRARRDGYAIGAFNFCNAETLQAIVEAADEARAPVIAIVGPLELPLLGPKLIRKMAEAIAEEALVPVCLHLDHAPTLEMASACLDAGFPSVMLDGSHLPFEGNVALTRRVAELARAYGATVEGELGALGRTDGLLGEGHNGRSTLTDPLEARAFVERTGIDALAISVGNAHGVYCGEPNLDFERLAQVSELVDVPIVLHGGTGIPREQFRRAIKMGVCKVNVATELALCYGETVSEALQANKGKIWPATVLVEVKNRVRVVAKRWIDELDSANRADWYQP